MTGQVIAVASGKGGVGRTTAAINIAVELRMEDIGVCLVDGDIGMPNLGTQLSITNDTTLHDVLAGTATVEDAVIERVDDFGVIIGNRSLETLGAVDPKEPKTVTEELASRYEYVIVDTGSGVSFETMYPLRIANEVMLVTTDEPAAVDDTQRTAELARAENTPIRGVILSRTDGAVDSNAIASRLDTTLLGTVPLDPVVAESTAVGKPLALYAPESPPRDSYRSIVSALVQSSPEARQAPNVDSAV